MSALWNTATVRRLAGGDKAPDWRHEAGCGDVDPDVFFGLADSGPGRDPFPWELAAKQICTDQCPVLEQCRRWALESGQEFGVAGGMTAQERRAAREKAAAERAKRPAAEYDELTVEHLVAGQRIPGATYRDLAEAAVRLHKPGESDAPEIAMRIGAGVKTVQGFLERHRKSLPRAS